MYVKPLVPINCVEIVVINWNTAKLIEAYVCLIEFNWKLPTIDLSWLSISNLWFFYLFPLFFMLYLSFSQFYSTFLSTYLLDYIQLIFLYLGKYQLSLIQTIIINGGTNLCNIFVSLWIQVSGSSIKTLTLLYCRVNLRWTRFTKVLDYLHTYLILFCLLF